AAPLAQSLTQQGIKVVMLNFLNSLTPQTSLPPGIDRVVLEDRSETHLQQQLDAIASTYGSIASFIHLHPLIEETQSSYYPEGENAILKQVFFIAKHLKTSLNQAAQLGRSCFLTVAHLDGELGLSGKHNFSAIAGGLFGLTKSLRWEWQSVFCRAIDLSPDLALSASVEHIIAELHDPNRLIAEVGYGGKGRVTLK
ncbi:MAG: polyketide synthase, partial [Waterburya sp.]